MVRNEYFKGTAQAELFEDNKDGLDMSEEES